MSKTVTITPRNHKYQTTFGGLIYNYDFDGYNDLVNTASRIAVSKNFDTICRKNLEGRKRRVLYVE